MASTRPNLISPEQIEFVLAYCLFSFSVFGVERIASGLTPRAITSDVPAAKDVPCSEIFSRPFRSVLLLSIPLKFVEFEFMFLLLICICLFLINSRQHTREKVKHNRVVEIQIKRLVFYNRYDEHIKFCKSRVKRVGKI